MDGNIQNMSDSCQAIVGFLVPRRSCRNLADTQCRKCQTPICHAHTKIQTGGSHCTTCALPETLQGFRLDEDVYFSEDDLLTFADKYRKQAKNRGDWVDFT